jgi:hypothetical protein
MRLDFVVLKRGRDPGIESKNRKFPIHSRYRYFPRIEAEFVDRRENGKLLKVCFNTRKN